MTLTFHRILDSYAEHTIWIMLYGDAEADKWIITEEDRLHLRSRACVPHHDLPWLDGVSVLEGVESKHGMDWPALVALYALAIYGDGPDPEEALIQRQLSLSILNAIHEYRLSIAPRVEYPSQGSSSEPHLRPVQ